MSTEKKLIWAILIIMMTFSVGFFVFAVFAKTNMIETKYQVRNLQAQINALEKGMTINSSEKDDSEVVAEQSYQINDCKFVFENSYTMLDENFVNYLSSQNSGVKNYLSLGYSLKEVCNDLASQKTLYFFDNEKGFTESLGKVDENQISDLSKKIILAISDLQDYTDIEFYQETVDDYRFEGSGGMACHFDKYAVQKNTILYICTDVNDNGKSINWYAYDESKDENILTKNLFTGSENSLYDKDQIFNEEYLNLFSTI